MAREGMSNLIGVVRRLSNAGTADHTVAGTTYFTDDQIQYELDKYRETVKRLDVVSQPEYIDGDYQYLEYPIPPQYKNFEEAGADSGWAVRDNDGSAVGTALYSINYEAAVITFDADQDAETYYVDFRAYDVNRAVADIWEMKASFYETLVDWSSDNHSIKQSQQVEHARKMAAKFRSLAGVSFARRVRVDEKRMPPRRRQWK